MYKRQSQHTTNTMADHSRTLLQTKLHCWLGTWCSAHDVCPPSTRSPPCLHWPGRWCGGHDACPPYTPPPPYPRQHSNVPQHRAGHHLPMHPRTDPGCFVQDSVALPDIILPGTNIPSSIYIGILALSCFFPVNISSPPTRHTKYLKLYNCLG